MITASRCIRIVRRIRAATSSAPARLFSCRVARSAGSRTQQVTSCDAFARQGAPIVRGDDSVVRLTWRTSTCAGRFADRRGYSYRSGSESEWKAPRASHAALALSRTSVVTVSSPIARAHCSASLITMPRTKLGIRRTRSTAWLHPVRTPPIRFRTRQGRPMPARDARSLLLPAARRTQFLPGRLGGEICLLERGRRLARR